MWNNSISREHVDRSIFGSYKNRERNWRKQNGGHWLEARPYWALFYLSLSRLLWIETQQKCYNQNLIKKKMSSAGSIRPSAAPNANFSPKLPSLWHFPNVRYPPLLDVRLAELDVWRRGQTSLKTSTTPACFQIWLEIWVDEIVGNFLVWDLMTPPSILPPRC